MQKPAIFLVDNGSLRPQATFALRDLADRLSAGTTQRIEAVSLLHSHKIPATKLGGLPATIVKRRMRELVQAGQREFMILPLFLGPSLAITDYLPTIIDELRQKHPDLIVRIAEPVAGKDVAQPDLRLCTILAESIATVAGDCVDTKVALVDHGTPIRPVNTLRNRVASELGLQLGRPVQPCSMERREGPDYAFNDPLLENLASVEGYRGSRVILAMFFLLPGRHAGEGGDVADIVQGLVQSGDFKSVEICPLLGEHPLMIEILRDRLASLVSATSS